LLHPPKKWRKLTPEKTQTDKKKINNQAAKIYKVKLPRFMSVLRII